MTMKMTSKEPFIPAEFISPRKSPVFRWHGVEEAFQHLHINNSLCRVAIRAQCNERNCCKSQLEQTEFKETITPK